MSKGKIAAQAAHASVGAYIQASDLNRGSWAGEGQKKVVLGADTKEEFLDLYNDACKLNWNPFMVHDAGHTQVLPGVFTAFAIGPLDDELLDELTNKLKLL